MQLGLKRAAADGEDCPDGQKPAPVRRGRPPSAKCKAKATAKSKGASKKPQPKFERKTTKSKGKAAPVPEEPKEPVPEEPLPEEPHMPEEPVPEEPLPEDPQMPEEPVPEEPLPSARKTVAKRKSKQIAADGSAGSSKKVTKAKKATAGAGKKPPAGPGGPGGDASADNHGGEIPKCFARRRRPQGGFSAKKWDAMRHAFQLTVMPHLQFFSAHEATDGLTFFCCSLNFLCFWFWSGFFPKPLLYVQGH